MTYLHKLAYRSARARWTGAWTALAISATLAACGGTEPTSADLGSTSDTSATELAAGKNKTSTSTTPTSGTCIDAGTGRLITLSGSQGAYDSRKSAQSNDRIDARNATWKGTIAYAANTGHAGAKGLCWTGGNIAGTWDSSKTAWSTYHSSAAMLLWSPSSKLVNLTVKNYGDAIRLEDAATDFSITGAYIGQAHDDCVENDRLHPGSIDDSYMRCYVFLSERPGSGVKIKVSGAGENVTINNSLIWHKATATGYRGTCPCTGPLFKWPTTADTPTGLVINNTMIRVDQKPSHGDLIIPTKNLSGSGNTIVWTGKGTYPGNVPAGWTLTTDVSKWNARESSWLAAHPGR